MEKTQLHAQGCSELSTKQSLSDKEHVVETVTTKLSASKELSLSENLLNRGQAIASKTPDVTETSSSSVTMQNLTRYFSYQQQKHNEKQIRQISDRELQTDDYNKTMQSTCLTKRDRKCMTTFIFHHETIGKPPKEHEKMHEMAYHQNRIRTLLEKKRTSNRARMANARKNRTIEERERDKKIDRLRKEISRTNRRAQKIEKDKKLDQARKATSRTNRTSEEVDQDKANDKSRKSISRKNRSTQEIERDKKLDQTRKSTSSYQSQPPPTPPDNGQYQFLRPVTPPKPFTVERIPFQSIQPSQQNKRPASRDENPDQPKKNKIVYEDVSPAAVTGDENAISQEVLSEFLYTPLFDQDL